jgi:hypothetical protein
MTPGCRAALRNPRSAIEEEMRKTQKPWHGARARVNEFRLTLSVFARHRLFAHLGARQLQSTGIGFRQYIQLGNSFMNFGDSIPENHFSLSFWFFALRSTRRRFAG